MTTDHDRRNAAQIAMFRNYTHGQPKPARMDARVATPEPTLDDRALALVTAVIGLNTKQVAAAMQIKLPRARKVLSDLEEAGRIRSTRGGVWEVIR